MPSRTPRPRSRSENARRTPRIRGAARVVAAAVGAGILAGAAPAAAATLTSLLSQGSTGPAVTQIQHALHIGATGRFDPRTGRAVQRFQHHARLLTDGIVGPQTWGALLGAAPAKTASTSSGASSASSSQNTGGYTIPSAIVQCESGGNYSAVNPQSGAGGAYQILPSTWQAYGGQGLPQDAPKAEQDRIAAAIYASQGASAWSC